MTNIGKHPRHTKAKVEQASMAERDAYRVAQAEQLAKHSGLPIDDVRIEVTSWALLALAGAKQRLLSGTFVDISALQNLTDSLKALLPEVKGEINIRWTEEAGYCRKCRADVSAEDYAEYQAAQSARALKAAQEAQRLAFPVTPTPVTVADRENAQTVSPEPPASPAPAAPANVLHLTKRVEGQPTYAVVAAVNDPDQGRSPFDRPAHARFDNTND